MKIAVASKGDKMDSLVSEKLGRADFIIIYDSECGKKESVFNPGKLMQDGSGVKIAEMIIGTGADILLSMNVGVKAYSVLTREHVVINLIKKSCSVNDAINNYLKERS